MYNARIGFMDGGGLQKTTNCGVNWVSISGEGSFSDMHFIDSLTGWKSDGFMKKTTDGGLTWINQTLPQGGYINLVSLTKFSNVNKDTIWGVGGRIAYPNNQFRGIIYKTTNGGDNWLFQLPDTNINIVQYRSTKFLNKLSGWAYSSNGGVHTTTGGDTIWYTGIQHFGNEIPSSFNLKQNYPNPFNPRTLIPYSLKTSAYVRLIAYDIIGREVQRMVDSKHQAGEFEVDFMGKFTSTGVYFYRIEITNEKKMLFTETKKMVLLK